MARNQNEKTMKDAVAGMALLLGLIAILPILLVVTITLATTVGPFVLIAAIVWGLWAYLSGK